MRFPPARVAALPTSAATDNAAFMAEGVPNLILLQDESVYFTAHHTIADTFDMADVGGGDEDGCGVESG